MSDSADQKVVVKDEIVALPTESSRGNNERRYSADVKPDIIALPAQDSTENGEKRSKIRFGGPALPTKVIFKFAVGTENCFVNGIYKCLERHIDDMYYEESTGNGYALCPTYADAEYVQRNLNNLTCRRGVRVQAQLVHA